MRRGRPHAAPALLDRYAAGDDPLGADSVWALETHLESCAACRAALAAALERQGSVVLGLLERVREGLEVEVAASAQAPARHGWLRRRMARWAAPRALPWLGATVLVVLMAMAFDLANQDGPYPSLVLLVAPVAPLAGVAAAWARGMDPAHELVAATPRAGLYLVLRRTLAALAVVIPLLAAVGWAVGASPARWLLPSLAFTTGTLALGGVIGIARAAAGLAGLWTVAVIAPSLATYRLPGVLQPASLSGWALVTVAVAVVLVARADAYTRLLSQR